MGRRALVIILAVLIALPGLPISAVTAQAAQPGSPTADSGGALVPYHPPTGQYVDPRPFTAAVPATPVPRIVTTGPDLKAPRGYVAGKSTEMPLARSANRTVYANPDGTYTARVYGAPVNWLAGPNSWLPIDNRIVTAPDGGFTNASGPMGVHFAKSSGPGPLVQLASGGASLGFAAPSGATDVRPVINGNTIRYPGALANVDLEYHLEGQRLKEFLVLRKAPAGGSGVEFQIPLQLNGLRAALETGGGIRLYQGTTAIFEIPAGQMADSKRDPGRGDTATAPVQYSLAQTSTGTSLVVKADGAWLSSPARRYPVYIDPTVTSVTGAGDSYVRDDYPNYNSDKVWNSTLQRYEQNAGYYDSTTGTEYSFFSYDLSSLGHARIISASWNVYFIWSYYRSTLTNYYIHPVAGPWAASTITWNNQPSVGSDQITDSAVRGAWRSVDMASWVQNWTSGAWPNYGIEVDEGGAGQSAWKKMAADENTDGSRSYLQINYEGLTTSYGFLNSDSDPPASPTNPSYAGPAPNTAANMMVYVTNNGTETWPANGVYRLSYHVYTRGGSLVTWDGARTYLPVAVGPGQSIWLNASINPIATPGSYTLQWDMVEEGVTWFSWDGVPTAPFRVFVASPPTPQAPADKSTIVNADRSTLAVTLNALSSATSAAIHRYVVSPSRNFDTALTVSLPSSPAPNTTIPAFTTPPGALKDGARYYWKAVANDGVADSAATVASFDMDSYQFGSRSTWAMDSIGLGSGNAAVNLATGNLVLSIPGISLPTVSQPLSLGVTYNSYAALLGAYIEDRTPLGATDHGFNANWDQGRKFMGQASVVVPVATGAHQDYFQGASETLAVPQKSTFEVYVYLDPANLPAELMVQLIANGGTWEHRAYWGANDILLGTDGTPSRFHEGNLPAAGQWVRLQFKASDLGISTSTIDSLNGVAFTLYGGRAWFDHFGVAQPGLGPGFQIGNQLALGDLSLATLTTYDTSGTLMTAGDMSKRVDRADVRETDGTNWVFHNTAPLPAPGQAQPWPQMTAPSGVMETLVRNADGSWSMSGQDGLSYVFGTDGSLTSVDLDQNQGSQPSFQYGFDPSAAPARLTSITDPMGRVATLFYDGNGRLQWVKTWDGRKTSFWYDPNTARLTSIKDPAQRTTSITYNDLDGAATQGFVGGLIQSVTNPRTYTTTFTYGNAGQLADHVVQVTGPSPSGPVTKYTYASGHTDVAGPRCVADAINCPNGYSEEVQFDNRNRVVASTDALGNSALTAYDSSDRVLMSVDRTGARTDTTYDSEGRTITTISTAEAARTGAGLYAEYYGNADLSGRPTATRTDQTVDFAWTTNQAAPVPLDVFSVRWTGYVQVPQAGSWTFFVNSKDGARLRVGSALLIDNWTTHATADSSGSIALSIDPTKRLVPPTRLSLEYFSASANPEVHLSWLGPGVSTRTVIPSTSLTGVQFATSRVVYDEAMTGLRAAYYSGTALSGRPVILRTDSGTGGAFTYNITTGTWPGSPLGTTNFSVRWSGSLVIPASGTYLVGAISDDGVRVFLDGNVVAQNWTDHSAAEVDSVPLALTRGPHRLAIEYYQNVVDAQFNLRWERPGMTTTSDVPTADLAPDYGLVTSSIDANGALASLSYTGGGLDPVRGLQTDKSIVNTDADAAKQTYVWHNTYDTLARKTSETSPKGMTGPNPDPNYTTTYSYFPAGDAHGRDGLLSSVNVPGRGATTYYYEAPVSGGSFSSGRMTQKVDQRGTWTYLYDDDGLQTQETPPGRTNQPTFTVYNADGNVSQVSDPQGGTITYTYDELDRVTGSKTYDSFYGTQDPGSTVTPNATYSVTQYDPEGHPLATADDAGTLLYHYDARGWVDTITDPAPRLITFKYDADGRVTDKKLPNGTVVHYTRDAAGRLTLLQNQTVGAPETDYSAVYDPTNRITSQTGPDGQTVYAYDTVGRLETWTGPSGKTRYYFDLNSNRTQKTGVVAHAYTYQPDATDRLLTVDTLPYGYDPAGTGDTVSRPGQSFTWDAFGQLQSVTTSSDSVTYTRDELGRVRERVQKDGAGTITADTIYRFDGSSDAPAYETNQTGAVTMSYLSGPDGLTVSYAGKRGGAPTFDYSDIHGNVVLTADANGAKSGGPYYYDPFGVPTNSPTGSPYGFVGKWQKLTDPLSGLIIMGARPYDPLLGRFLSVDALRGGSVNDYDYASQDPVNQYDLSGNCIGPLIVVCAVVVGLTAEELFALSSVTVAAVVLMARRQQRVTYYNYDLPYNWSHGGGIWPGGGRRWKKPTRRVLKGVTIVVGIGVGVGLADLKEQADQPRLPRPSPAPSAGPMLYRRHYE